MWPGFCCGGGYKGGFFALLRASPMSERANANPRLQNRPASGMGWAHQKWEHEKDKKLLCISNCSQRRQKWEYVRETTLHTPRSVGKERSRWSSCWSWDSPLACGADHGEAGCTPAAHGSSWGSRDPPAGTPCQRRWIPEGGCEHMVNPHWMRFLAGAVGNLWGEEPMLEQVSW